MDLSKMTKDALIALIEKERAAFAVALINKPEEKAPTEKVALFCSQSDEFHTFDNVKQAIEHIEADLKDNSGCGYGDRHSIDDFTVFVGREVQLKTSVSFA